MNKSWLALLRGINVGGNNIIKMAELREALIQAQLENVRTYIQSGNVLFESPKRSTKSSLEKKIRAVIEKTFSLDPSVLVLSHEEFTEAVAQNPFSVDSHEPKTVHFFFLAKQPKTVAWNRFDELAIDSERYELKGKVLYFLAPDGLARSKLAATMDRLVGVAATGRNLRTVNKIEEMFSAAS